MWRRHSCLQHLRDSELLMSTPQLCGGGEIDLNQFWGHAYRSFWSRLSIGTLRFPSRDHRERVAGAWQIPRHQEFGDESSQSSLDPLGRSACSTKN